MKRMKWFSLVILAIITFNSCEDPTHIPDEIMGMRPVYIPSQEAKENIKMVTTRPTGELGKIVYQHPYLFINEINKGIHIYDNSNPINPQRERFIELWGNIDFAVKDNLIYANNFEDLVTLKITGFDSLNVVNRIENFYKSISFNSNIFPEDYAGYFECYDETQGVVAFWEFVLLQKPQCYR